jgi:hypothetical protein
MWSESVKPAVLLINFISGACSPFFSNCLRIKFFLSLNTLLQIPLLSWRPRFQVFSVSQELPIYDSKTMTEVYAPYILMRYTLLMMIV